MRIFTKKITSIILLGYFLFLGGCTHFDSVKKNAPKTINESASINTDSLITEEKTTFHFIGIDLNPKNFRKDETEFMKELERRTNIHIVWDMVPQSSWKEKKNIIFASGILPDAFYGIGSLTGEEILKYGSTGTLMELNDLIEKYAPNINGVLRENKTFKNYSTSTNGNIYALANLQEVGIDSHIVSIIKQDWLDRLGLKMPTTTDEFYNTLKAFKENDPNGNGLQDEIPFSFLYSENTAINREVKREYSFLFGAFGINDAPRHIYIQDNGNLIFTANQNRWKSALQYIHQLYAEGLIDPEVFTQDRKLLTTKIMYDKNIGAYPDFRLKWSSVLEEDFGDYAIMPPLEGPYGDRSWNRAIYGMTEGTFAITNVCKNPEALMKWLNYTVEPENSVQMEYGMFQTDKNKFSDKRYLIPSTTDPNKWASNEKFIPAESNPIDWEWSSPIASGYTIITKQIFDKYISSKVSILAKQEDCSVYRPYLTKYPYNYPFKFTTDEIDELSLLQGDLLPYIYKTEARWIVEGNIDLEWDTYLDELKKLGVDRYLEIYKTAFERTK